MRRRWNEQIKKANLVDYNDWIDKMAGSMEQAYYQGDTKDIFEAVRKVSGKARSFSSKAPSTTKQGEMILDQDDLTKMWRECLEGKFE